MKRYYVIFIALVAFFFLPSSALANVGLVRFTAVSTPTSVTLEWQTATELDSVGFHIERVADGEVVRLTDALIPAAGNPTVGASYTFVDETAVFQTNYTYQLIELRLDGSEQPAGDVAAALAEAAEQIAMAPPPALPSAPTQQPPAQQERDEPANSTNNTAAANPIVAAQSPEPTERGERPALAVTTGQQNSVEPASFADDTLADLPADNPAAPPLQETPVNGYPEPPEATAQPEGYNPNSTSTPILPTDTPVGTPYVPPPTQTPRGTLTGGDGTGTNDGVSTLGSNSLDISEPEQVSEAQVPLPTTQGRIYLWLAFIGALLVFGMVVLTATLIFSRKTQ